MAAPSSNRSASKSCQVVVSGMNVFDSCINATIPTLMRPPDAIQSEWRVMGGGRRVLFPPPIIRHPLFRYYYPAAALVQQLHRIALAQHAFHEDGAINACRALVGLGDLP